MAAYIIFLALVVSAETALVDHVRDGKSVAAALGREELATIPVHMFRGSCGRRQRVPPALAQLAAHGSSRLVPGAGMDPSAIEPYAEVLKDGYFPVDCVKDRLLEEGDKFGANKFAYKLGDVTNVSIVRYSEHVPKEDREPMSISVCFEFCRTVPHMSFFGLAYGRECYCEPYYEMVAGDSSACDAVCEGETTKFCGGMAKSSIFEMHWCADAGEELAAMKGKAADLSEDLSTTTETGKATLCGLQTSADILQAAFGQAGDTGASNALQGAKVAAGDLEKAVTAAEKAGPGVAAAAEASVESEATEQAEQAVEAGEMSIVEGELALEGLQDELGKLAPAESAGALKGYVTVPYLVEGDAIADFPSTCGGTVLGYVVGSTADSCAASCDARPMHCVGFSFFESAESLPPICALFSKFTSMSYYTGCDTSAPATNFLQGSARRTGLQQLPQGAATKCYAKFSELGEISLKPDPSGKCKHCLKSAVAKEGCTPHADAAGKSCDDAPEPVKSRPTKYPPGKKDTEGAGGDAGADDAGDDEGKSYYYD